MRQQSHAPYSDILAFQESPPERIEGRINKSAAKRHILAIKKVSAQLVALPAKALTSLPLEEDLLNAIYDAQKIKREGQRRQLQRITKMLRERDLTELCNALNMLDNTHKQQNAVFHHLEQLRETLLSEGEAAIPGLLATYPHADRAKLRSLLQKAQKKDNAPLAAKASRQLFQYLRLLAEENEENIVDE